MENLNAEQIKKALEKVEDTYIYLYMGTDGLWHEVRYSHILALTNSQEQKIKELTEENERLIRDKTALECVVSTARNQAKADTVRKMQELIYERLDISVEGYSSEEIKSDVRDMVYQIAKEMLEEEK